MHWFQAPKNKLLLAGALLAALGGTSALTGLSFPMAARGVLVIASVAGLLFWWSRAKRRPGFALPDRLQVLSRTGLSQRCGLALVEADGQPYLVAFGDGFAVIQSARKEKRRTRRALVAIEGGAR